MSDFFLELYSEEIPHGLQIHARKQIHELIFKELNENNIKFKGFDVFSTPKRLVVFIENITLNQKIESQEVKGPKVGCNDQALEGFLKSKNALKEDLIQKITDKGEFYFVKLPAKTLLTSDILRKKLPSILQTINWKKSMRWSDHDCFWGRPLRSIMCLLDNKVLDFSFFHINSSNSTYVNGPFEDKEVKIKNFKDYKKNLEKNKIEINHIKRESKINIELEKLLKKNKCSLEINDVLVDEVTNLVETPIILKGKFDPEYLVLPDELLNLTMVNHQRYFPMKSEQENKIINSFLFVANNFDNKNLITKGNEKVIDARLSDAKFFWDKNKRQNLVKQVTKLNSIIFYQKLGTLYDKTQRIRQLSSVIADTIGANKEDTEIAGSICKADLVSDLVGEYPELQGTIGRYFALEQGFSQEISNAIQNHYLPLGPSGKVPKEKISIAVAVADKIDTLIGFFGIYEKPTSSKDPFALRRACLGVLRLITENKISLSLKEILNNSKNLYLAQNYQLTNEKVIEDLFQFFIERFKINLRDKGARLDVTNSILENNRSDDFYLIMKNINELSKCLKKSQGQDAISIYKRSKNILDQSDQEEEFFGNPDNVLFQHPSEDEILIKLNEARDYFTTPSRLRDNEKTITLLSELKPMTDNFFDNVKVNDDNQQVRKNRLELLTLLCKTFEKFTDFSKLNGS
ncbi:MAG: glycine--tRNA ligase subunit beta [Pelagibacteraceae bacterium]|nr:glycine--tRNA ligase subunit beta [Pelagibacteraceae bacterium]OUV89158.1 MAG: glycine--tRNA ligase subunit beta [Pelagibacteraceae bacterium TMED146]|tara:strand:- start:15163 stop:17226 length:2064 start_codon:yes stop_codon:yes gene_type:complete